MSAGIWFYDRDGSGLVTGARILVRPCANEDPEIVAEHERLDFARAYTHGLADAIFDDGATLLCWACSVARRAEDARQARLRRLPPIHRQWLADRGVTDWPIKVTASPAEEPDRSNLGGES